MEMMHRGTCEFRLRRFDRQQASVGHGIPGVHDQIHEDLFQLPGVGLHVTVIGVEADHQLDVFTDEAPKHAVYIADDRIQWEDFRFQRLLSAEGHELANQARSSFSGFLHLFDLGAGRIPGGQFCDEDLTMPHDDRQQIVEIMGESSRETSHRFHLLGLTKLFFAHAQRVFRSPAFQTFVEFSQGSFNGGRKPAQALLGDVVGRSSLHHVDGELLSLRA